MSVSAKTGEGLDDLLKAIGGVLDNDKARACLSYLGHEVKRCCEASGYQLPELLHEQSPETFDLANQAMFDANQRVFLDMYSVNRNIMRGLERVTKKAVIKL